MKEGPSTETIYLREKLHGLKDIFKYFQAPRDDSYLMRRQKGELEGLAENMYKQLRSLPENHGRTGTYDLVSKLDIYNPATSFSAGYVKKRNPYEPEYIDYLVYLV